MRNWITFAVWGVAMTIAITSVYQDKAKAQTPPRTQIIPATVDNSCGTQSFIQQANTRATVRITNQASGTAFVDIQKGGVKVASKIIPTALGFVNLGFSAVAVQIGVVCTRILTQTTSSSGATLTTTTTDNRTPAQADGGSPSTISDSTAYVRNSAASDLYNLANNYGNFGNPRSYGYDDEKIRNLRWAKAKAKAQIEKQKWLVENAKKKKNKVQKQLDQNKRKALVLINRQNMANRESATLQEEIEGLANRIENSIFPVLFNSSAFNRQLELQDKRDSLDRIVEEIDKQLEGVFEENSDLEIEELQINEEIKGLNEGLKELQKKHKIACMKLDAALGNSSGHVHQEEQPVDSPSADVTSDNADFDDIDTLDDLTPDLGNTQTPDPSELFADGFQNGDASAWRYANNTEHMRSPVHRAINTHFFAEENSSNPLAERIKRAFNHRERDAGGIKGLTTWVNASFSGASGGSIATARNSSGFNLATGGQYQINERLALGIAARLANTNNQTVGTGTKIDSNLLGVALFSNILLPEDIRLQLTGAYEYSTNDVQSNGNTGSFDYDSLIFSAAVSKPFDLGNGWTFTPSATYSTSQTEKDGYTNSAGVFINGQEFDVSILSYGGTFSGTIYDAQETGAPGANGVARIGASIGISGTLFLERADGTNTLSETSNLQQEDGGATLSGGLNFQFENTSSASVGSSITFADGDQPWSVNGSWNVPIALLTGNEPNANRLQPTGFSFNGNYTDLPGGRYSWSLGGSLQFELQEVWENAPEGAILSFAADILDGGSTGARTKLNIPLR